MRKSSIPVVHSGRSDLDLALSAIKQNLDSITGMARGVDRLKPLPETATLAQVIAQLNAVVDRLQ